MSINRRQFLKIAGISSILGLGSAAATTGLLKGRLEAVQDIPSPEGLTAKRWGMVVDMSKFKTPADYQRVINACHSIHNVPTFDNNKDEVKWIWTDDFEHTFPGHENGFKGEEMNEKKFIVMCNHCAMPACVRVCPTKATFKRKDGIVMMDMHRCIGCRFCMAACPFGARSFNWRDPRPFIKETNPNYPTRTKGVVEKCTFCTERLEKGQLPACAEESAGGLVFGDIGDPNSEARKLIAKHFTIRRKPELGTEPSVYYIIGGGENA
jgi:molybdopterin-containing oxidoreductase family iron-sulfur binding subunit